MTVVVAAADADADAGDDDDGLRTGQPLLAVH